MDLADIIAQAGNGRNLQQLQQQFGLNEAQTRTAMNQLLPAVEAGIRRETSTPDQLSGLLGALANGKHERYLDGDDAGIVNDGNGILGHIFGSKDVSRGVAAKAAESSGIGSDILKKMLPVIAAMAMGALAKQFGGGGSAQAGQASGGGLGDLLGQVLGGGSQGANSGGLGSGGLGGLLGSVLGGQGGAQAGGGGLTDILNIVLGGNAAPETRNQATQKIGGVLGDLLGGNTARGSAADDLLSQLSRLGKN